MILVTGAGGTVGTALIAELQAEGRPFRLAHRSALKAERARAAGHDAVTLDFSKRDTLPGALEKIDTVFLLGAGGIGQTEGEIAVIAEAKAAGATKIVKLSVWGAEGEDFAFAKIHRPIERALETSGLAWTILRPNAFMQNFIKFMSARIRMEDVFCQPAAQANISFIDVRDIARVAARVLTDGGHEGKAYGLTGPAALSYHDTATILSRVLARSVRYVPISDEDARARMVSTGIPSAYADYLVDLNRSYREGGAETVTSAVEDITGRKPTSFERFIEEHAAAFTA